MMSLLWLAVFLVACIGVGVTVCGFVAAEQTCREARGYVEDDEL